MSHEDHKSVYMAWLVEHGATVVKVARAYTLTHDECQDLTQEIFLQAWKSLAHFQYKAKPMTWFYRVALQTAMNWHRNDQSRRTRQKPFIEVETIVQENADVAELAARRETVAKLYQSIQELPHADTALVLLYLEGLSYHEISEVLGITENSVGVRLNRAKTLLGKLMKGEAHGA